jgi:cytochrome P450
MEDFYDPYMPEIMTDPYPVYARMRRERPVYRVERFNAWALALFEDIWEASQDAEHFTTANSTADRAFLEGKPAVMATLNSLDPPRHTELRKRLFAYFGPRAARELEPRVRQWTRECLARHRERGSIDAVGELAQQVAVRVACTVSGFPMEDADYLVDLVTRFFAREPGTEGMSAGGASAQLEAFAYLEELARRRRASGEVRPDALGVFLQELDEDGKPLDPARVGNHLTLLLVGATETFPKVFATGLLRLWQHPDQRRELAADPGLIPTALLEILRYDMPTQWLGRTVTREHEIRGHRLHPGQPVLFLYPSGNRDEREFRDPDRFDIHRNAPRMLTFGHGVHRCLGAFMASMEGKVLLEEVLAAMPDYAVLLDEAVKPPTEFVQGYARFPIAFANG